MGVGPGDPELITVAAQRAIAAGETVINLGGPIRAEPTRYTLQVSEDEHIEPAAIEETPGPDEGEVAARARKVERARAVAVAALEQKLSSEMSSALAAAQGDKGEAMRALETSLRATAAADKESALAVAAAEMASTTSWTVSDPARSTSKVRPSCSSIGLPSSGCLPMTLPAVLAPPRRAGASAIMVTARFRPTVRTSSSVPSFT